MVSLICSMKNLLPIRITLTNGELINGFTIQDEPINVNQKFFWKLFTTVQDLFPPHNQINNELMIAEEDIISLDIFLK